MSARVRESRSGDQGSFPEALRVSQSRDIRFEVILCGGFDVAVSEHFAHDGDIRSRRQSARRPRVTQVACGHIRQIMPFAPASVLACGLWRGEGADESASLAWFDFAQSFDGEAWQRERAAA